MFKNTIKTQIIVKEYKIGILKFNNLNYIENKANEELEYNK